MRFVLAVAALALGCTGGEATLRQQTSASSSSSATTGAGGEGGAGGQAATTTGAGGAGGQGGAPPANGPPGTELVSAGEISTSPSYVLVFTLGQPTQNQGKTTSPGYRLQGGLAGANGSLP